MNRILIGVVCALQVFAGGAFAAGHEIEELQVYIKRETLAGTVFVYRVDIAMGSRKEAWTVNGRTVTEKEYETLILEAEKELRRQERQAAQAKLRARQDAQLATTLELYKKILSLSIDKVEAALTRCNDARLAPHLQFGLQGGLSRTEFDAIEGVVESAKKLLVAREEDVLNSLQAAIANIEPLPDRLNGLIQASMGHATKHCDDTKILKELLGLVPLG